MEKPGDCGECGRIVLVDDKRVACGSCDVWYHIKCAKVKNGLYEAMRVSGGPESGLHWFCAKCNKNVMKCLEELETIKIQQRTMEKEIEDLKGNKEVIELKERSVRVEKKLDDFMASMENVKKSIEEKNEAMKVELKKDVEEAKVSYASFFKNKEEAGVPMVKPVDKEDDRKFQMRINEGIERSKRMDNLVVMGIKESEDNETEENITEVLDELISGVVIGFKILGRIGKEDSERNKVRPVRIQVLESQHKRRILSKAKDLKKKEGYERVYIVPDLTRQQQFQDRQIKDEFRKLKGAGAVNIKIEKGQIIKKQDNETVVLFSLSD